MMNSRNKSLFSNDIPASFVVFLVALPLCMGIAIASGVPPARGLITGIVGGIIAGSISGSPLLVSGPAAGLVVVVAEIVHKYGIEMVGPILLLAGLIQYLAGISRLGQLFRAMSPAVIYGMLAGIGILIIGSQFHVMLDDSPHTHGLDNLLAIPGAIHKAVTLQDGVVHEIAGLLGVMTIAIIVVWDKFKPRRLKLLPGALISVVVVTTVASFYNLEVNRVDVAGNLLKAVQLPTLGSLPRLINAPVMLQAFTIALIASAESLLSAVAVDRLHTGSRSDFDKELAAQGIGNMICGFLGALPMTGVIARSSVNVEAGGKTRLSTILHGIWLLVLVVAAPGLLRLIPTSCLAAILVYTGYKLIEVKHIRQLRKYGRLPMAIFFATLIGIVTTDLLSGVIIGIVLTSGTLIYKMSNLIIQIVENEEDHQQIDIYLQGAATFVRLPQLAKTLEKVPAPTNLHVHLENLAYIDHSCLDLLSLWAKQQQERGSIVIMRWEGLMERNRHPFEVHPTLDV
ncbi:SulP family inorganic anion transporter [Nostoc cf. edaphicum LEGE 07299]|uniref:SulP family inorganic anion transporter n=1 Tax=Nostoc cf. edaphicum LEGE 07299 TaxID=2777974 RepID=A0ABR9TUX2_9NOSO|nr:SulP family inorganic anion transporter [Nostoc edaphicum]MBE9104191.1 SulP family inorganic anion transporter [Nostoc cf. edaphicum LEGE 07299]